jgi:hypothetical protein
LGGGGLQAGWGGPVGDPRPDPRKEQCRLPQAAARPPCRPYAVRDNCGFVEGSLKVKYRGGAFRVSHI